VIRKPNPLVAITIGKGVGAAMAQSFNFKPLTAARQVIAARGSERRTSGRSTSQGGPAPDLEKWHETNTH
jgi:hypothetical protein